MCRVERVGLEHHGNVALGGMKTVNGAAIDANIARGNRLKAGNGVEQSGLTAARWTDQHEESAFFKLQIDPLEDVDGAEAFFKS